MIVSLPNLSSSPTPCVNLTVLPPGFATDVVPDPGADELEPMRDNVVVKFELSRLTDVDHEGFPFLLLAAENLNQP